MQTTVTRRSVRWDNLISVAFAISAILVLTFTASTIKDVRSRNAEWKSSREVITVYVESGDTLDEFGYKYKPEWMDVREYREEIKELNGMQNSDLYMGQELKLYTEGGN